MTKSDASDPAVELIDVAKIYQGRAQTAALRGVSLRLSRGTFTAVMGPSGSGKSTLLHCAAGLDRPSSGRVQLAGTEISGLREPRLTVARRTHVGFVFQSFNLIPSLSVLQNVLLPTRLAGRRPDRHRAMSLLERVGLGDKIRARPGELSGGQQQRVAVARALVSQPDVIFGDEPTGALDITSGRDVLALLRAAVDGMGAAVVMVTHDPVAAAHADRVIFLADGRLAGELAEPSADRVAAHMTELVAR